MTDIPNSLTDPFFRNVVDAVGDGVVVLESSANIVFANAYVTELLGYESDELRGQPIERLFPQNSSSTLEAILERTAGREDGARRIDCSLAHKTGTEVPVALTAAETDQDGRRFLVLLFQDVAVQPERSRSMLRGQRYARPAVEIDGSRDATRAPARLDDAVYAKYAETLHGVCHRLLRASTRNDVARVAVNFVQTVFSRAHTAVWLYDAEGDRLEALAEKRPLSSGAADAGVGATLEPISSGTVEMKLFRDRQTRLITGYRATDGVAHPESGFRTRLVIPLGAHGLLTVGSTDSGAVDEVLQNLVGVLAAMVQAAFDRLVAEETIRYRSMAMASARDGIAVVDETDSFLYVNYAFADLYGYDDPEELVGTTWQKLYPDDESNRIQREIFPIVTDRGYWRDEVIGKRVDGTRFHQEHSFAAFDAYVVCVVRDITRQKVRERRLEALNEVGHELIRAETDDEITRIGIETVENVFDFDIACIRLFDEDANQLERVVLTDEARELLESQTAYDLETTLAGRAFRAGETVVNEGSDGELSENSSLHVPIGSYGVLSVLAPDTADVDNDAVYLLELLAVGINAALAQAERIRLLSRRERELHNLRTGARVTCVVTETITALVAATNREQLDRTLCERLAASDLYRSAWVGRVEETAERVEAPVGAGVAESYLDAIPDKSLSEIAGGIIERAIEANETQVVHRYQSAVSGGDQDELDGTVEAIAAVPITYDARVVGVLVVNSDREDVFSEDAIDTLDVLGEVVGFARNAIQCKELLRSKTIVELEFTVRDPSLFYVRLTDELDCSCEFERAIPIENGRSIVYQTVFGAEPGAVLEIAEEMDAIESARVVSERDGRIVLQTIASRSIVHVASELGATVRSAGAEGGSETVAVEVPPMVDIRETVAALEREFEAFELVAKRKRERSTPTRDEFRKSIVDRLTEKQYMALESAYFAGYYDWPRQITAQELADSMDIASATLHQHLRKGNQRLLATLFEASS